MTDLAGPPGSSFPFVFARGAVYPRGVRARCGVLLFSLFSLLACVGCLPAPEGETRADSPMVSASTAPAVIARTGNAWSDCYRRFQPGGDPAVDLARLADACAAPAGMRPITPLHEGAVQTETDAPERLVFRARRGRCYRAFAVGAPGVEDLDVAVYERDGHLVSGDVSRDRWPVVPPRGPLCAEQDGTYTIAIAVTRGSGAYVFQVWGTELARGDQEPR